VVICMFGRVIFVLAASFKPSLGRWGRVEPLKVTYYVVGFFGVFLMATIQTDKIAWCVYIHTNCSYFPFDLYISSLQIFMICRW